MKSTAIVIACALPLCAAAAEEIRFIGEATVNGDSGAGYRELHSVAGECSDGVFRPLTQTVTYVRDDNESFAEKKLDYTESVLRPSVDFRQPDFDEVMDIRNRDDRTLSIEWQTPSGETESFEVDVTATLVADSGFDNLVRANWDAVTSGDTVEFDFLAPTRGKSYGFVLEPAQDHRINAAHTVRIEPSGTILSFLVDPILLGYDDNGYLTDYVGLTNIRKDDDTNYAGHIRYAVESAPDCDLIR